MSEEISYRKETEALETVVASHNALLGMKEVNTYELEPLRKAATALAKAIEHKATIAILPVN